MHFAQRREPRMFTRSTLPMLATLVSLACGASAGAEAFDPLTAHSSGLLRRSPSLSSSDVLRADTTSLRSVWRDRIAAWSPTHPVRSDLLASWPDSAAARGNGRLNFQRLADDERVGTSSALISLGRLNLNEPRSGPALGATSPSDLDRELAQLRESMNRVRPAPQVSLGMRVKF